MLGIPLDVTHGKPPLKEMVVFRHIKKKTKKKAIQRARTENTIGGRSN